MRLCIVTVYNSENCGSYLQAYALGKVLTSLGHNVTYLWRKKPKRFKDHLLISIKKVLKFRFWGFYAEWKKYTIYNKLDSQFKTIKKDELDLIDCIVIGSDTVWNFEANYFLENKDTFTGRAFGNKKRISYAASVGNTRKELFESDLEIIEGLRGFDRVSVRDYHTKKIIDEICGIDSKLVLDPTLLLTKEDYAFLEKDTLTEDYLLIYMFGKIEKAVQNEILNIAKKENCKIVSFGEYNSWADYNVVYDPLSFLAYFHHSKLVVTNTFHGTVFSVIYNKRFIDLGVSSNKIVEFLRDIELEKQLCYRPQDMMQIASLEPHYDEVNRKLAGMREVSIGFLNAIAEDNDEI